MTSEKTPQPGEWWVHNETGDKVYFIGHDTDGTLVWDMSVLDRGHRDWSSWHHAPWCTSWDSVEPKEQEWFDLTSMDGHVLRACRDEAYQSVHGKFIDGIQWPSFTTIAEAKTWGWTQFRCRIEDAPKAATPPFPSQEENPRGLHQKYIIEHVDGKPINPNAVYFVLRLDGDHAHNQASRFAALEWADVIDDECETLKPVADELRVLVERLTPATPPVESPDDWVTQDRVAARPKVDQERWVDKHGTPTGGWKESTGCSLYHGENGRTDFRLELRCRRKDLPPIESPPSPQSWTFHEVIRMVPIGDAWTDWQLLSVAHPKTDDICTGRTETREVVVPPLKGKNDQ